MRRMRPRNRASHHPVIAGIAPCIRGAISEHQRESEIPPRSVRFAQDAMGARLSFTCRTLTQPREGRSKGHPCLSYNPSQLPASWSGLCPWAFSMRLRSRRMSRPCRRIGLGRIIARGRMRLGRGGRPVVSLGLGCLVARGRNRLGSGSGLVAGLGLWRVARRRRLVDGRSFARRRMAICHGIRLVMPSMPGIDIKMAWRHGLDIRHFGMVRRGSIDRAACRVGGGARRVGGRAVCIVCVCTGDHATGQELRTKRCKNREFIEFVVHVTPLFLSSDK